MKTKAGLKRRMARLMEKRDRMNEEIDGCDREIKVMDEAESRKLLERYSIESEELAKLILYRERLVKEQEEPAPKPEEKPEPKPDKNTEQPQETYNPLNNLKRKKEAEQ